MKVIFQDIDGVLLPFKNIGAMRSHADDVKSRLLKIDSMYQIVSSNDLCIAYESWSHDAMVLLKKLCDITNAVIVISSSWKFMRSLAVLKQLFAIYDLKDAVVAVTDNTLGFLKEPAITEYLKKHPEIQNYVVLDDLDMRKTFGRHAIVCSNGFDQSCYNRALAVLQEED